MNALFDAIGAGDGAAVDRMLADDPTLARARREGVSAVLFALYHRQPEIAARLAAAAGDLDVFEAAALGHADRLTALLEEDGERAAAFTDDGWTPLHLAAFFGHADAALVLLHGRAPVLAVGRNAMANQPLHAAAAGRSSELVEILLERGADPNARQAGGWTALHEAAQSGDGRMVDLLLAHGADPSASSDEGVTPADLAARAGHERLAARLGGG